MMFNASSKLLVLLLLLLLWLGVLSFQPHKALGLTSPELALRHNHQRSLRATNMNPESAKSSRRVDPNQSDKRRVRRGSDPIHNSSSWDAPVEARGNVGSFRTKE
ncbi:CLAVATA3/ESR (CLE)-related protein 45 [Senna tora]|uniref:CLAVATA3/ESR (CLE)-related protein 45 n=1 Tax=Senna tora TaxID=362788 RepID=A0A834TXD4_9FABA|nr:CLAVATA3/ESR (CLE)-related protein 45 [Senna tora]